MVDQSQDISPKSRLATVLLAFFFGTLGVHRFYIGKVGTAIAILVLWLIGFVGIYFDLLAAIPLTMVGLWVTVDFFVALFGGMQDSQGRPIKRW